LWLKGKQLVCNLTGSTTKDLELPGLEEVVEVRKLFDELLEEDTS